MILFAERSYWRVRGNWMLEEFEIGKVEEYIEAIRKLWNHDYGTFRHSKRSYYGEIEPLRKNEYPIIIEDFTLELHTGGWLENEEIIKEAVFREMGAWRTLLLWKLIREAEELDGYN